MRGKEIQEQVEIMASDGLGVRTGGKKKETGECCSGEGGSQKYDPGFTWSPRGMVWLLWGASHQVRLHCGFYGCRLVHVNKFILRRKHESTGNTNRLKTLQKMFKEKNNVPQFSPSMVSDTKTDNNVVYVVHIFFSLAFDLLVAQICLDGPLVSVFLLTKRLK